MSSVPNVRTKVYSLQSMRKNCVFLISCLAKCLTSFKPLQRGR